MGAAPVIDLPDAAPLSGATTVINLPDVAPFSKGRLLRIGWRISLTRVFSVSRKLAHGLAVSCLPTPEVYCFRWGSSMQPD